MTLRVEALAGPAVEPCLGDLARLRIAVFADYPYLYHGDLAYEEHYLREYAAAAGAVLVPIAFDFPSELGRDEGVVLVERRVASPHVVHGTLPCLVCGLDRTIVTGPRMFPRRGEA